MVYVFLCIDMLDKSVDNKSIDGAAYQRVRDVEPMADLTGMLADCLQDFPGAVVIVGSRTIIGRRIFEVRENVGRLGARTLNSVNVLAESPYEFVEAFMENRREPWVAIAASDESFPAEWRHRVAILDDANLETVAELRDMLVELDTDATAVVSYDDLLRASADLPVLSRINDFATALGMSHGKPALGIATQRARAGGQPTL